jgi:hypothetical protein
MKAFEVVSRFSPSGDQPAAIEQLVRGLRAGEKHQVLLGVTGSGKTFTMANVIAALDCPTLVLSPNKILAAQLYAELKAFFPKNAVEYFISYYDYYQPEAYVPQSDTYIEKDASINDHIDRLRLKATSSLLERRDVIVVASVSAIYGLTQSLELGIASGYQRFATQQFTGRDTLNNKQYDILQYSGFPVLGIVRMRWQRVNWAPEVEIGAGALIGKIQTRSTQLNIAKLQKDGPFWEGHASVGSGFEWGEDYTVHFHVGYAGVKLGQNSYKTSSYNIEQKNLQHGLFFKGLVRYQF